MKELSLPFVHSLNHIVLSDHVARIFQPTEPGKLLILLQTFIEIVNNTRL